MSVVKVKTVDDEIVGAILKTWGYIKYDYGKTTVDDEIGAALDRVDMHGGKVSPEAAKRLETLGIKEARAILKTHGVKRLWDSYDS